jgi:hypothetical protein
VPDILRTTDFISEWDTVQSDVEPVGRGTKIIKEIQH